MRVSIKRLYVIAGMAVSIVIYSCTESNSTYGSFTDKRDGQTYPYVKIDNKNWMAKNLNYKADGSWCYDNEESNCDKYGRLYDWNTAINVCPAGWYLPSDAEWTALTNAVGGVYADTTFEWAPLIDEDRGVYTGTNVVRLNYQYWARAGTMLKSKSGWNRDERGKSGNGTDKYGFSALPGGFRISDGDFFDVGDYGRWWSATERDTSLAWSRDMDNNNNRVYRFDYYMTNAYSVRCVSD